MATPVALDPSALSAFAASLVSLPKEEVRKAKSLFIRNAIADYRMTVKTSRGFLYVFAFLSIIPVFLIVLIPAFIGYRAAKENGRQKIINALDVWRDDLREEYDGLLSQITNL